MHRRDTPKPIQDLIRDWADEYHIPRWLIYFDGYGETGHPGFHQFSNGCAHISIDPVWALRCDGFWVRCILWNEMAHAVAYLNEFPQGGSEAQARWIRRTKFKYHMGYYIAQLVYPILKLKR